MACIGPKRQQDVTWVYPSIEEALNMVGLDEIGVYTACRQNTVTQYIFTRTIMDLCLSEDWKLGLRLSRGWREQTALDIPEIRAGHAAMDGGRVWAQRNQMDIKSYIRIGKHVGRETEMTMRTRDYHMDI